MIHKYLVFISLVMLTNVVSAMSVTACKVEQIFAGISIGQKKSAIPSKFLKEPAFGNVKYEDVYPLDDAGFIKELGFNENIKSVIFHYYKKKIFDVGIVFDIENKNNAITPACFEELKNKVCIKISNSTVLFMQRQYGFASLHISNGDIQDKAYGYQYDKNSALKICNSIIKGEKIYLEAEKFNNFSKPIKN